MGADDAEQFSKRSDEGFVGRATGLDVSLSYIRRAAQIDAVIVVKVEQQHAQRSRALRLGSSMMIKCLGGRCRGFAGLAVDSAREGLQQLFGILKIAAPHEPRAFARQAISCVGGHAIVGNDDAFRRCDCIFRAPARGLFGACFAPLNRC